jgi:hypothetical protein
MIVYFDGKDLLESIAVPSCLELSMKFR